MKTLFRKIGYNFIISFMGKILGTILSLFIIAFITRALGKSGFGEYSIIFAFLYFFGVAADFGLYVFLIREVSKKKSCEERVLSDVFTLRFFLALGTLALAPLVSFLFPYSLTVKLGILIGALGYLFMSLSQVLVAIFQKKLKMWAVSFSEILGRFIQFFLIFLFIRKDLGIISFICAFVAGSFITFIFNFIFANKLVKINPVINVNNWKNILIKSWPYALSIILTIIYFKIDTILLSVLKNPRDVGIYSAAYKILEATIVFPAILTGLFLPLLAASLKKQDVFKKIAEKSAQYLIIFGFGVSFGGFILAAPIIQVVAGSGFTESAQVLKILFFAIAIIFMGGYFGHLIIALGVQKKMNKAYFLCVFLNVIGNLLFIPKYSYIGAAYITLFTEILVLVFAAIIVYKKINWFPNIKNLAGIVISSFGMALFLLLFQNINYEGIIGFLKLGLVVSMGAIIYLVFLILLKIFKIEDVKDFLIRGFQNE